MTNQVTITHLKIFNFLLTMLNPRPVKCLSIDKFNFFKIKDLAIDSSILIKKKIVNFSVYPTNTISQRFKIYLKILSKNDLHFKVKESLFDILKKIEDESNSKASKQYDRFLQRILGILCKTTFIGPEYFHLDISNPCNIDCNYCWFYSKYLSNPPSIEFKKSMIKFNDFKNIIDDLAKLKTDTVLFTGAGEPFLHPKINDMIKYVKSNDLKIQIFTNGTIIDEISAKNIVKTKTDELFISVSASNPDTYVNVHPKQKKELFFDCQRNIKRLVNLRNKKKQKKPNLVTLFVLCKDNYKDILEMARWSDELGVDSVRYQIAHNKDSKNIELNDSEKKYVRSQIKKVIEKYKNIRLHINPNILFQLENSKKNNEWYDGHYIKKGCYVGWFFSRLWADNIYSFCCIKKEVEHLNQKNSFELLWKSKKYSKFRDAASSGGKRNIELKKNYHLIDKDCSVCGNYEINEKIYNFLVKNDLNQYVK